MGVDAVGGEIVLQTGRLKAGFSLPVSEQAEGSGTGDAGGAELVIDEKRVGHLFSLFSLIFLLTCRILQIK